MPRWFGAHRAAPGAALELALLAARAEGPVAAPTRDRIARALVERPELAEFDWDWVTERLEALGREAPLFTDARERITAALRPLGRTGGLAVALRFAWAAQGPDPLDDARVVLRDVAARLDCPLPAEVEPLPDVERCAFSDPEDPSELPLHEAFALASPTERRLLLFKLQATRAALQSIGEDARVTSLGGRRPVGPFLLRLDAEIGTTGARVSCRCLAQGEALHPGEHLGLPRLLEQLALGEQLLLVHQGPLLAHDAAVWASLDPAAARRLELPRP